MKTLSNLKNLSQLAKAAQTKRGKEVLTVGVGEVVSKPQVRKRFRNIEELALSIKAEGQQSPIIVSPQRPDGKYVIQKGERRWRACQLAGLETIDVIVNDKDQTELDETAGELIENIQRDDLTPMEIANALNVFQEAGWKQKQIANRIGKSISFVSTHLSLLRLPECVLALYEQEITADNETLNNLRRLHEVDAQLCESVCANALTEGITRNQSRELLNNAREPQSAAPTSPAPVDSAVAVSPAPAAAANELEAIEHDNEPVSQAAPQRAERADADLQVEQIAHVQIPPAKPTDLAQQWEYVRPDALTIKVRVATGGEILHGTLLLDRVAKDPSMVWVQLLPGISDAQCVKVSDVELVSVG